MQRSAVRLSFLFSLAMILAGAALAGAAPCTPPTSQAAGLPGLAPGLASSAPIDAPAAEAPGVDAPEVALAATCIANCGDGSTVTCSTSSGSCTGISYNCSTNTQGYVRCGSTQKNCPYTAPPQYYCADILSGAVSVCPERCIGSGGGCGQCSPAPNGCLCLDNY